MPSDDRAKRTRETIIDIAKRRQKPGSGSSPKFLAERIARVTWPDLRKVLEGVPWAVAGAVATRMYMPERATQDLDIVVLSRDSAAVRERLGAAGYNLNGALTIGGSMWTAPDGTSIDVIESSESWLEDALNLAQSNRDAQHLPVLPLPHLVLMKLEASRAQDVADVTRMLGGADDATLGEVRAAIRRCAADLADDLESLIALGQLELRDPDRPPDRA